MYSCYWEKESFCDYDAVIIGSGIIGLSAALMYKKLRPNDSVLILEQGLLPAGASTKNAGFACFGSLTEILADIEKVGEQAAVDIIQMRLRGLALLRERLGDSAIGYEPCGSYELIFAKDKDSLEQIERINSLLAPITGSGAFELCNQKIEQFGFDQRTVAAMVFNRYEGALHTGKMMQTLLSLARRADIQILTGARVAALTQPGSFTLLEVRDSQPSGSIRFKAARLGICTNGFTSELLPQSDIKPGRGQVLVTTPIHELPFEGTFHFDHGYFYFRNIGNRVLFGGGRNLQFAGETITEHGINALIASKLDEYLRDMILPGIQFGVEHRWSGIMGFNSTNMPEVKRIRNSIVVGFGCNGMGVAIGSLIGDQTGRELAQISI